MIAKRMCKASEEDGKIFYWAFCSCGEDTCNHSLSLENSEEGLWLSIWVRCDSPTTIWERLKFLFTGRWEWDYYFLFKDKEQIEDYIDALESGIERLKRGGQKDNN